MTNPHQYRTLPPHGPETPDPDRRVWWRHLFVEAEDAQLVCDLQGTVTEANLRATELFGLRAPCSLFAGALLAPGPATLMREALAREPKQAELLRNLGLSRPDGSCLITDVQLLPFDAGLRLLMIKDASRRRRLETHTQRLLAAIDSTPDVVILTDAQFCITFVNPAFEEATGYVLEEVLGRSVDACQAPGEQAKTREYLEGAARGADWVGELMMLRRDGSSYPVEMTFSPVNNMDAEFIGAVAFQRDISARKRIHEAFLAERTFVRSIINSLDASLYTLDGRLHLTHFNNGWSRMPEEHGWLKLDGEPQVGRPLLDYVPDPGHRAELEKAFSLVLAEGQPQALQAVDSNGHHWLMSVFPWQHEGQIRGLIYKVMDNTGLVRVQQQLLQAQKMGIIGALAAGIAHDFNNLLLAIRGNVSLALMDPAATTEIRDRLGQVESAAMRASDLTQQLLSFSRESEEKVTVLDFNEVIRDAAALARRMLRSKVTLKLLPAQHPIKVRLDPTRALQVLLNLCINAFDAMPDGGTLTVANAFIDLTPAQQAKLRSRSHPQFMRCSVTDTGAGIPPEILPRIFDPFFTTKGEGRGTGLGLSIVHTVVGKAGGFIEVQSTVGSGTTFHVYLPVDTGPLTRIETEFRQNLTKGTGRLLLVDDLDLVLEFGASFLRQAGYQVFTANSAEAALKILTQQRGSMDLVFTDYAMPGKTGWQLIQEAAARWPLIKFILASGYLDDAERAEIARNAGVKILNKPYGITEATGLIASMLGTRA